MTDNEPKTPYAPTTARRFELSHDEYSRERVRALLKAYRTLKGEVPFFAGITLYGSLSKGKKLTGETAPSTDIDLFAFIDVDLYEATISNFEQENEEFQKKVKYVSKHDPAMRSLYNVEEVRRENVRKAAQAFIEDRITEIMLAELKQQGLSSDKISIETDFINIRDDDNDSISNKILAHNLTVDSGLPGPKEENLLFVAAPFFYDIGGGLRKYREAFMKKLLAEPADVAEEQWKIVVEAMKTWERQNQVPDSVTHTYPQTLEEARKYYKGTNNENKD